MTKNQKERSLLIKKESKNNHLKDTTHNFFAIRETLKKNGNKSPQNNKKSTERK